MFERYASIGICTLQYHKSFFFKNWSRLTGSTTEASFLSSWRYFSWISDVPYWFKLQINFSTLKRRRKMHQTKSVRFLEIIKNYFVNWELIIPLFTWVNSYDILLSVFVRRLVLTFYIFNFFMKTTKPIVNFWCEASLSWKKSKFGNLWLYHSRGATGGTNMQTNKTFQKSSLLPHIWEKTVCMVMMSMKPFTKTVKIMVPGSGNKALGRAQYINIVKLY